MLAGIARDEEGEPLGIIDLDTNLADVEKPPELPAGNYTGEVQDVQIGTSAGKGNKYFAVKFVILPSEIPANIADHFEDGCVMYYNRMLVPSVKDRRALFAVKRFVEALGLSLNTTQIDPNEWMGKQARLKVVMGKWQGEDRAEIRSIESAEAPRASANRTAAGAAKPAAKPAAGRGRK